VTLIESIHNKIASTPGTPSGGVFILEDDDQRHTAVLITPTQGYSETDVPLFHENFQILSRAKQFTEAQGLAWKVYVIVRGYIPKDSGVYLFGFPDMTQPPSYIGTDDKGRHVFSFNFTYPITRFEYL
jgi:hypothetical protein